MEEEEEEEEEKRKKRRISGVLLKLRKMLTLFASHMSTWRV